MGLLERIREWHPWTDPDPLPPVDTSRLEELEAEAEKTRWRTLEVVRRRSQSVDENHFADDVEEALGL